MISMKYRIYFVLTIVTMKKGEPPLLQLSASVACSPPPQQEEKVALKIQIQIQIQIQTQIQMCKHQFTLNIPALPLSDHLTDRLILLHLVLLEPVQD